MGAIIITIVSLVLLKTVYNEYAVYCQEKALKETLKEYLEKDGEDSD